MLYVRLLYVKMAKKKKKQQPNSTPKKVQQAETIDEEEEDAIEVTLTERSSNNNHSPDYQPRLFIPAIEARRLGVEENDVVVLVPSATGTGTNVSMVAATATVSIRQQTKSTQISPSSLFQRFMTSTSLKKDDDTTDDIVSTCSSNNNTDDVPYQEESPSKSKFSFIATANEMSSPLSASKIPKKSCSVHVIPFLRHEKKIATLFQKASSIQIRPIKIMEEEQQFEKFTNILRRLILATHQNTLYVQRNDKIYISFQGRTVSFQIISVQSITTNIDEYNDNDSDIPQIESLFENLNLQSNNSNYDEKTKGEEKINNDDNSTTNESTQTTNIPAITPTKECIVTKILKPFELKSEIESDDNKKVQYKSILYQITKETKINFVYNKTKEDRAHKTKEEEEGKDDKKNHVEPLIAGMDSLLHEIKSIIWSTLLQPHLFSRVKNSNNGIRPPKGILVHGPSGVGKTLLATQLAKTFHQNYSIHVEWIDCHKIQSMTTIVGQAERYMTKRFSTRNDGQPSLFIVDDIHLICPRRNSVNTSDQSHSVASTLLALLDGIGNTKSTSVETSMVLAVTSNAVGLDPALRRPGRLDMEFEIPIPDESTKAHIFQFILSKQLPNNFNDISGIDTLQLSRWAKGFTGADCTLSVKEALRHAIISNKRDKDIILTMEDLKRAIQLTKPSSIQSVTVEVPSVPWSAIGGMTSVKKLLQEAVEWPLEHADLLKRWNIPAPKGVLLYGPPGCSKTLMARALATQGNMNFVAIQGPELLSKWLGESERALASLFHRARMASPCILFFDEIDAIGSHRSGGSSSGTERLLSQLLTELDGIHSNGGDSSKNRVVVVGATNRPDLLDTALMRPGRMDRMIYVGLPDVQSRQEILQLKLQQTAAITLSQLHQLAMDTDGYSGAELVAICRHAALYAIADTPDDNDDPVQIQLSHLHQSISNMKPQITTQMLEFYASFRKRKR